MNAYYLNYIKRLVADYRVSANADLADNAGNLLCKSGEVIGETLWSRLTNALPESELASSITISQTFSSETLVREFEIFFNNDPWLEVFYQKTQHRGTLERFLKPLSSHCLLMQHLTLLHHFLPEVFNRALFCSWFLWLIYDDLDVDEAETQSAFSASLCHDLGLLQLDKANLELEEGPGYYEHVNFSADLLRALGFDEACCKAVREHHEHLDGSGQPRALVGSQLSHAGQYIHLLDSLYRLYAEHFRPRQKALSDTIPIIEMNSFSHFGFTAKATINVLNRGACSPGTVIAPEVLRPLVQDIQTRYHYIAFANGVIQDFTRAVGFRHDDKDLFGLQNCFIHIALTLDKSTLLNPAYMRWLDHVVNSGIEREHHLIEVAFLMTNEVLFHLEKFKNQLTIYKQTCKSAPVKSQVESTLEKLQSLPLPDMTNLQSVL